MTEFDKDIFESIVEKIIVGGINSDGEIDPAMLTIIFKTGDSSTKDAKSYKSKRKNAKIENDKLCFNAVTDDEKSVQIKKTAHVETVALLSKLDVDKHIDVEIKLDELDLTSAESKATYAQIKKYILEKFDLKVSTLYIAQIKKKCGIALREHYNKSKKRNRLFHNAHRKKRKLSWMR